MTAGESIGCEQAEALAGRICAAAAMSAQLARTVAGYRTAAGSRIGQQPKRGLS